MILSIPCNGGAEERPAPQIITEKDRGGLVKLRVGQKLVLNLRNPATGGYTASPPVFDAKILNLQSQESAPPEKRARPRLGDFGTLIYEWEAIASGQTEVVISTFRSWEKQAPERFFHVKVVVTR